MHHFLSLTKSYKMLQQWTCEKLLKINLKIMALSAVFDIYNNVSFAYFNFSTFTEISEDSAI